MAMRRKVLVSGYRRDGVLHVEVEGAIINVREGLTNDKGKSLTHIEILPDNNYSFDGSINNRVIKD